jgi:hypothetical protein
MEAYCVRCKKKVEVKNPKVVTMKNKRKAVKGTCSVCHGGVYKIGG